jgi:hypothetical protein
MKARVQPTLLGRHTLHAGNDSRGRAILQRMSGCGHRKHQARPPRRRAGPLPAKTSFFISITVQMGWLPSSGAGNPHRPDSAPLHPEGNVSALALAVVHCAKALKVHHGAAIARLVLDLRHQLPRPVRALDKFRVRRGLRDAGRRLPLALTRAFDVVDRDCGSADERHRQKKQERPLPSPRFVSVVPRYSCSPPPHYGTASASTLITRPKTPTQQP